MAYCCGCRLCRVRTTCSLGCRLFCTVQAQFIPEAGNVFRLLSVLLPDKKLKAETKVRYMAWPGSMAWQHGMQNPGMAAWHGSMACKTLHGTKHAFGMTVEPGQIVYLRFVCKRDLSDGKPAMTRGLRLVCRRAQIWFQRHGF